MLLNKNKKRDFTIDKRRKKNKMEKPTFERGVYDETATYYDVSGEDIQLYERIFLRYRDEFKEKHGNYVYIAIYKNPIGDLKYDYDEDIEALFDRLPTKRGFIERIKPVCIF